MPCFTLLHLPAHGMPAQLIREVGYEVVQISSDSPDITVLGGPALPSGATIAYFGQNASTIVRPSAAVSDGRQGGACAGAVAGKRLLCLLQQVAMLRITGNCPFRPCLT